MPDLRGLFLRGYGGQSEALGVQQGDAIRNITGGIWSFGREALYTSEGAFTRSNRKQQPRYVTYISGSSGPAGVDFDASLVVPTAKENRPVNMSVRYLIRALP